MTPRTKPVVAGNRVFVLDTNVLMDDPAAIFRFDEHDICIPMVVLEELDAAKKGLSDVARNARQASRFLNELMQQLDPGAPLQDGIPIPSGMEPDRRHGRHGGGRLFFPTRIAQEELGELPLRNLADNVILGAVLAVQAERPDDRVTLVTKDINLRIKATILGIAAEDYFSDTVLEDDAVLDAGVEALPDDFWDSLEHEPESWQADGRTWYRIRGEAVRGWRPNLCLYSDRARARRFEVLVRERDGDSAVLEVAQDFRNERHAVWGIHARNREQSFALNLLMDPDVDLVTILGPAGTGKTLLTLAAGLAQTLDQNLYNEIIVTRVTIPLGEDIGFLPGTEEEKMEPWMGALMDNLEVLARPGEGGAWGRAATEDLLRNRIKIRSLNFMRGRTFLKRFVILDEAQNLTSKQMKALITRAGPGTKMVCLGNLAQIDTPYLTESTSGLTYLVSRFRQWPHAGHVTLLRGERSRLADFASEVL